MDNNFDKTPAQDPIPGQIPPRTAPRRPAYRAPIILGSAVLAVAIAGLLISTPRPASNIVAPIATENAAITTPEAETGAADLMAAPAIEPASDTAPVTPSGQVNTGITPPAPLYATEEECETASQGRNCFFQSCTQTDPQSCPVGFQEGWQAAIATPDNTAIPDIVAPEATPAAPTNAAITPQAAPAEINAPAESGGMVPRNDGTTSMEVIDPAVPNDYNSPGTTTATPNTTTGAGTTSTGATSTGATATPADPANP